MNLLNEIKPWLGVFLSFCATFSWRFVGLLLAEHISPNGLLMRWINAVAYSMVSGVLMLVLVNPSGILLSSNLESRLLGLFSGIMAIYITKNLIFSIITGMAVFWLINEF